MNKILLTTLFSGYNYGSSLQAFATKCIIEDLGYDCELVARKSLVKGRNVHSIMADAPHGQFKVFDGL